MKGLCVIPARGGSKRIPRKNIKIFNGKPMIAWSIECAIKSGMFNDVIVSTDDDEIMKIAKQYGATTPFKRPKALSDDFATTQDVIKHSINEYSRNDAGVEYVCCLYATSPLTFPQDILKAVEIMSKNPTAMVFPATTFDYPIQRALLINQDGWSTMIDKKQSLVRSQDLPETFHDAGQFYCAKIDRWKSDIPILEESKPLIIPRWRAQDIDTEEDWKRAEIIARAIGNDTSKD